MRPPVSLRLAPPAHDDAEDATLAAIVARWVGVSSTTSVTIPHFLNSGSNASSDNSPAAVQAPCANVSPTANRRASTMAAMHGISGPWS